MKTQINNSRFIKTKRIWNGQEFDVAFDAMEVSELMQPAHETDGPQVVIFLKNGDNFSVKGEFDKVFGSVLSAQEQARAGIIR